MLFRCYRIRLHEKPDDDVMSKKKENNEEPLFTTQQQKTPTLFFPLDNMTATAATAREGGQCGDAGKSAGGHP